MKEDFKYIVFLLVIVAGFFLLGRCTAPKVDTSVSKKIELINNKLSFALEELDSRVITGRQLDTVFVEKIKYRSEVQYRDTGMIVYASTPDPESHLEFTATLDSIASGDTVNVSYSYPANMFELRMRFKSDTTQVERIYEKVYETKIVAREIWLDVLSHVGASVVGILVGYAIGR